MAENSDINSSKNYSAYFSCVLLETAGIILVNLVNKREIKMKTFDQGSQKSYTTERVKSSCHESMSVLAFRKKTPAKKELQRACFNLKNVSRNYINYITFMYRIYLFASKKSTS